MCIAFALGDAEKGAGMLESMESRPRPENVRKLRRVDYEVLVAANAFKDARVELLDGQLVTKVTTSPLHSWVATRLAKLLGRAAPDDIAVRVNQPFAASDHSEPEPDVAVVPDVGPGHPSQALLVAEVCNTSDHNDRVIKMRIYADAGVPEYWIVDVNAKRIEIYTEPAAGGYTQERIVSSGSVAPGALPDAHVEIAKLFA
jgi:Uma2 family endonuclease